VLDVEQMRSSWIWDVAGVAALVAIFWPAPTTFWAHCLMPIPIGVLCVAAMRSHGLRRVLANQWVAVIGGMCYSIYLLHSLLLGMLFKITKHAILPNAVYLLNYAIQILLVVVPVVAPCAVFFVLIERPCMDPNWPSKFWHILTGRQEVEVAVLDAGGIAG
jgi:peptidoglycan/LPS O-acetylase OafA/YrhL